MSNDATEAERNIRELRRLVDTIASIDDDQSRRALSKKALEALNDLHYEWQEDHCLVEDGAGAVCGRSLDDGEGFDGRCGDHADEAEARGDYAHHDA